MARLPLPKAGIDHRGTKWLVKYDRDWQEWQVRAYTRSRKTGAWKFREGPTYYTTDRDDAIQTFHHLVGYGPGYERANPHDAAHAKKLNKQARAAVALCKLVENYGMASVGVDGTIRWLDGGVTHCGKNGLRTAIRMAAEKTIRHAQKHGLSTKKLFFYYRAAGF